MTKYVEFVTTRWFIFPFLLITVVIYARLEVRTGIALDVIVTISLARAQQPNPTTRPDLTTRPNNPTRLEQTRTKQNQPNAPTRLDPTGVDPTQPDRTQ
jgi:hypothetical protein